MLGLVLLRPVGWGSERQVFVVLVEQVHAGQVHVGQVHAGQVHAGKVHAGKVHAEQVSVVVHCMLRTDTAYMKLGELAEDLEFG